MNLAGLTRLAQTPTTPARLCARLFVIRAVAIPISVYPRPQRTIKKMHLPGLVKNNNPICPEKALENDFCPEGTPRGPHLGQKEGELCGIAEMGPAFGHLAIHLYYMPIVHQPPVVGREWMTIDKAIRPCCAEAQMVAGNRCLIGLAVLLDVTFKLFKVKGLKDRYLLGLLVIGHYAKPVPIVV